MICFDGWLVVDAEVFVGGWFGLMLLVWLIWCVIACFVALLVLRLFGC